MNLKIRQRHCWKARFLSLAVAVVFSVTSVSWNPSASVASVDPVTHVLASLNELVIPEEMGTISKTYRGERGTGSGLGKAADVSRYPLAFTRNDKMVILIQDAHAVIDAQENIAKILGHLRKDYGVDLVALEGAKGRLEPILLRSFPDEAAKRKVLAGYEKRAELSGPEMAAVLQAGDAEYRGIEDWDLYEKNYAAYLRAQQKKDGLLTLWNAEKQTLDQERASVYTPELIEFEDNWESFRSDRSSLIDLLLYLSEFAGLLVSRDANQTAYVQLPQLVESIGDEKTGRSEALTPLVRKIADDFKTQYLRGMGVKTEMNFYSKYQSFMTGKITAGQMLQFLVRTGAEHGKRPKLTSELKRLLGHTELLSEIKGSQLFEELQRFLGEVEASLVKTPDQKSLAGKYRKLFLLKDMINLELSYDDLIRYQKTPDSYLALMTDPAFKVNFEPALEFYQAAIERDQAFFKNIVSLMGNGSLQTSNSELRTMAVVAGGFHTNGLEALLKEKGIAYVVVTPRIQSLEGSENYAKVMKGDVSFKSEIKTTYFDGLMRQALKSLTETLPVRERVKTLKLWRDNLIRELARQNRITDAGKYLPYIDAQLKAHGEVVADAPQRSKQEILEIIRKELSKFKKDSFEKIWKTFEFQLDAFTVGLKELVAKKDLNTSSVTALIDRASQAKPSFLATQSPLVEGTASVAEELRSRMEVPEASSPIKAHVNGETVVLPLAGEGAVSSALTGISHGEVLDAAGVEARLNEIEEKVVKAVRAADYLAAASTVGRIEGFERWISELGTVTLIKATPKSQSEFNREGFARLRNLIPNKWGGKSGNFLPRSWGEILSGLSTVLLELFWQLEIANVLGRVERVAGETRIYYSPDTYYYPVFLPVAAAFGLAATLFSWFVLRVENFPLTLGFGALVTAVIYGARWIVASGETSFSAGHELSHGFQIAVLKLLLESLGLEGVTDLQLYILATRDGAEAPVEKIGQEPPNLIQLEAIARALFKDFRGRIQPEWIVEQLALKRRFADGRAESEKVHRTETHEKNGSRAETRKDGAKNQKILVPESDAWVFEIHNDKGRYGELVKELSGQGLKFSKGLVLAYPGQARETRSRFMRDQRDLTVLPSDSGEVRTTDLRRWRRKIAENEGMAHVVAVGNFYEDCVLGLIRSLTEKQNRDESSVSHHLLGDRIGLIRGGKSLAGDEFAKLTAANFQEESTYAKLLDDGILPEQIGFYKDGERLNPPGDPRKETIRLYFWTTTEKFIQGINQQEATRDEKTKAGALDVRRTESRTQAEVRSELRKNPFGELTRVTPQQIVDMAANANPESLREKFRKRGQAAIPNFEKVLGLEVDSLLTKLESDPIEEVLRLISSEESLDTILREYGLGDFGDVAELGKHIVTLAVVDGDGKESAVFQVNGARGLDVERVRALTALIVNKTRELRGVGVPLLVEHGPDASFLTAAMKGENIPRLYVFYDAQNPIGRGGYNDMSPAVMKIRVDGRKSFEQLVGDVIKSESGEMPMAFWTRSQKFDSLGILTLMADFTSEANPDLKRLVCAAAGLIHEIYATATPMDQEMMKVDSRMLIRRLKAMGIDLKLASRKGVFVMNMADLEAEFAGRGEIEKAA